MADRTSCHGCAEYKALNRRTFFRAAGGAALLAPSWLPRMSFATDEDSARDLIVCVFLRGGSDGLSLCVPHGDADYYAARPRLAVRPPDASGSVKAMDLDGFFGLPPALAALKPLYDDGALAIVHATGSPDPTRSHFEAQDFMEMGTPGESTPTGWFARHLLATAAPASSQLRAVSASHTIPRVLSGAPSTVAVPTIDEYGLLGREETTAERIAWLDDVFAARDDALGNAATDILSTVELIGRLGATPYTPAGGVTYPAGEWGAGMQTIARLAKADIGLEAACIDLGGWDTHDGQGTAAGALDELMTRFATGLAAFYTDMADRARRMTIVVMSEFGRRVEENGSRGTDHGHGNAMFVLGGHTAGGRIITEWPGLHPDQLDDQRDLAITIDYRDIVAEILEKRAGNAALDQVFPGYRAVFRGVVT